MLRHTSGNRLRAWVGGYNPVAAFLAGLAAADKGVYNFRNPVGLGNLFQDSAGTTPALVPPNPIGLVVDTSSQSPANSATQGASNSRPTIQTGTVARFDGGDDYLVPPMLASATAMTMLFDVVAGAGSASDCIAGCSDAGAVNNNNCYIFLRSDGFISAGYGSQTFNTFFQNGFDRRGTAFTVALTYDASNAWLYVDGVQVATIAAAGALGTVSNPIFLAALRYGVSSISNQFAGDIKYGMLAKKTATAAEIAAMTAYVKTL